jgi:hypothetical protein
MSTVILPALSWLQAIREWRPCIEHVCFCSTLRTRWTGRGYLSHAALLSKKAQIQFATRKLPAQGEPGDSDESRSIQPSVRTPGLYMRCAWGANVLWTSLCQRNHPRSYEGVRGTMRMRTRRLPWHTGTDAFARCSNHVAQRDL